MPRLLQFVAVLLMLVASRPGLAFSLIGPIAPNPGAEAWQIPGLGYNPNGQDIGAPKNLTEEYRWNVPVITYGFDASFINYFGTNGVAAVDDAFAILNSLPDLSSLSQDLREFPLNDRATGAPTTYRDARRVNLRALADNLVDMKSTTLSLVLELSGLANPERWVWALRDRKTDAAPSTNYFTIMRNFDPVTLFPSKYVNGNRYTYEIVEFIQPAFADALEETVDPEHSVLGPSSVAGGLGGFTQIGLGPGIFYDYLTRDDIGGLRYIYSTNNLNFESFPPGTQVFGVDRSNLILLTNLDLTLFSLRSTSSPPSLMSNFYPGLIITQATPGISQVVSNFPIITTQLVTIPFITNRSLQVVVSNLDLGTFSSITLTSAPANLIANLQAAFPGDPNIPQLVVLSTNNIPTQVVSIASIVLTNTPKQPWDVPFTTNLIFQTNFVTNLGFLYQYTFRNVITNYSSPLTTVRRTTTGIEKEPWSTALNPIYKTRVQDFLITRPSGGVIVVPTNLLGYEFTGFAITNVVPITNFVFITNVFDQTSGTIRTVSQTDVTLFTNVQYAAFPIELLPQAIVTNILVTNAFVTTNIVTFTYGYANVITNYAGPNTPAVETRFQIIPDPNNPVFNRTNIVSLSPIVIPVPSGGFLIDTNLTGFEFTGVSNLVEIPVTNIVFDITDPNTGIRTVDQIVYTFTNAVYLAFPFVLTNPPPSLLRPGISKLRFQRIGGGLFTGNSFLFTNRYTATFVTNNALVTNVFLNVQTQPDILIGAQDLGTFNNSVAPVQVGRNANFLNLANLNSSLTQGGPGIITPTASITFNKVGPGLLNTFPGFVTEASTLGFFFQPFLWGRFDGSTNPPIVFPKDISLESVELLITGGAVP